MMNKKKRFKCAICGKIFTVPKYREKVAKVCSMDCMKVLLKNYKKTDKYKVNTKKARLKMRGKNHPNYGRKWSNEIRERMSEGHKRNPTRYWLGKHNPHLTGEKNCNWKGGISTKNDKIRKTLKYREWRRRVFARDKYTCRVCGACSGNGRAVILNANHIYPFRDYEELRYDIENGITLCKKCHQVVFWREYLFIDFFKGIIAKGANSAKLPKGTTPSQQERLRKALWACVTVKDE